LEIFLSISKWEKVKKEGISGLPADVQNDAENLIEKCKSISLFIVPVGELESWIELNTVQKNKWIIKALEEINNNRCPDNLKNFINTVLTYDIPM